MRRSPFASQTTTRSRTTSPSTPRRVAIEIATGDIINQGETAEIAVPAQEAGEYFFVCDLHTDMNGTIVVE